MIHTLLSPPGSHRLRRVQVLRLLAMGLIALFATVSIAQNKSPETPPSDTRLIAQKAYTFAYPMVVMEMTRRATTQGGGGYANLVNHFANALVFPDDRFRQVIRPNADTLYSVSWLDLSKEPMLLHVPDTRDRYYLFQLLDAWSETIASPGKRTTGTGEGWFAIVGPGWKGNLPQGAKRIDCPTNTAWLLGRTQTNSAADYDFVHNIQRGYKLVPLSSYPEEPPAAAYDPSQPPARSNVAPPAQVALMSATEFFQTFAQLLSANPAHAEDAPMMALIASIGIVPGKPFPAKKLSDAEVKAIDAGVHDAASALATFDGSKLPSGKTGWTLPSRYGRYGTNYQLRAIVARYFFGALPAEDAVYLSCLRDSAGQLLSGRQRYVMHFDKGGLPPVRAFWSLSLYDDQGYFAANPIRRFAIGDRDALKFNADGSLDLYIQHDSPDADKESNWLPAPAAGFNLVLRMYWPEEQAIKGTWIPPAVTTAAATAGR
jgi:hypothetical protein